MSGPMTGGCNGWILCRDPRLSRLLETELAYLGISAVTYPTLPPPAEDVGILLADGDEFGAESCLSLAAACGCPVLIFGREATEIPAGRADAKFLRRPFALTELEKSVRGLIPAPTYPGYIPGIAEHARPESLRASESAAPLLTAADGVITVGEYKISLTPAEWAIFKYLHTRRGRTVTREELSSLLEGGGNIVDVYVCRLRSKIEKPLGRRMIWTVRGRGYRMET